MEKTTLVFVFLLTTVMFWLIAMTTPGWLVVSVRTSIYEYGWSYAYVYTSDVQTSVFYIRVCTNEECSFKSHYRNYKKRLLGTASIFESQVETLVVFVLYGISCILVMLPDSRCNRKRILSVVTIILVIAETTALMIIFRMCVGNASASIFASDHVFIHFPYSIFFAGFSLVVGIIALVSNYVALRSLINRDAANDQYLGLAPGDQHDYNQVLEVNFRRPNEASEDFSQETNNMAANYQYLELAPGGQHVYNQVPQENPRIPKEANEDIPEETNKMA